LALSGYAGELNKNTREQKEIADFAEATGSGTRGEEASRGQT